MEEGLDLFRAVSEECLIIPRLFMPLYCTCFMDEVTHGITNGPVGLDTQPPCKSSMYKETM